MDNISDKSNCCSNFDYCLNAMHYPACIPESEKCDDEEIIYHCKNFCPNNRLN
jgi:hypothetical protein